MNLVCHIKKLIDSCLYAVTQHFRYVTFYVPHNSVYLGYIKMGPYTVLAKLNNRLSQSHCISFLKIGAIVSMREVNNYKLRITNMF